MTEDEMRQADELAEAILNFIAAEPMTPPGVTIPALCMVLTSIVEMQEGNMETNKKNVLRLLKYFYQ